VRRVVASEYVSLDGAMESPKKRQLPYLDEEMGEAVGSTTMAAADAMTLGRALWETLVLESSPWS
jgi:hypothetical protein